MGTLTANFGASDAYTITLTWTELSQSVAKNQTTLRLVCTLRSNRASTTFTGQARQDVLTVGDAAVTLGHETFTVPGGGSVTLWTHDMTVSHDPDGTCAGKAVGFSVMIDTIFSSTGWIGAVEAAGTMTLTRIPRASTISGGPFTAGITGKFTITAASDGFTHKVSASFGTKTVALGSSLAAGSHNWHPVLSLLVEIPNATSGTGTLTCETYHEGSKIGESSVKFTLYAPDSVRPSITAFTAEPVTDNAVAAGWGLVLRTVTNLSWQVSAAGSQGSTVKSCRFTFGGVTASGLSGTTAALPAAGTFTPTVTVTDSRGRTATATLDPVTVADYAAPTIGVAAARRCDADGVLSPTGECCLLNLTADCASVGGRNGLTLRYRIGGGPWQTMTDGMVVPGFPRDGSKTVTLSAVDSIGSEKAVVLTVPAAEAAFHVREGGKGAAFGKYAESDGLLDVGWDLRVRGKAIFDDPDLVMRSMERELFSGDLNVLNDMALRFINLSTCANGPSATGWGLLETLKPGITTTVRIQRFTFYDTGVTVSRTYANSKWYPWSTG